MNAPRQHAMRSYQAWIANETLEDYALRYAPASFRKWKLGTIANTALGGISFLALEAIGGSITLNYGFANALPAVLVVSVFILFVTIPIAAHAAAENIDMDLLTRGAGFGYIGSTITSLIYVTFTFVFFALEGAIMAQALNIYIGLPLPAGYLISSLVIIPITFLGVTMISRLQRYTQPIWLALLIAPFLFILFKRPEALNQWTHFRGAALTDGHFGYLAFGSAVSLLCALVIQIGEQVDYLRFLPDRTAQNRGRWWATVILAGPGWIMLGGLKILCGSFLAVIAINAGLTPEAAVQPIRMYTLAYGYVSDNPGVSLSLATLFVLISQIKINVTNAYAGSLAWSNFFSRAAHFHPGRVVWLVFNIAISLMLMLLGIFETLDLVLAVYSNIAIAWIGAIVADLLVLKPLRVSPPFIEFKRAHLHNINPVGCGAMALASVVSITAFTGSFGPLLQAYSAPLSFAIAFATAILIGILTNGRYYLARTPTSFTSAKGATVRCEMCAQSYDPKDMAFCTFYARPICSLCCSLDAHCHDACKRPARQAAMQASRGLRPFLAERVAPHMGRRLAQVSGVLFALAAITAVVFLFTFEVLALGAKPVAMDNESLLTRLYLAVLPLLAVAAWWIVLARESRDLAERDLVASLERLREAEHELAKSERLAAIGEIAATVSHELRNPLGTLISSVAVLRHAAGEMPAQEQAELARIERNVWRCTRIIEDLLEFSRIREPVRRPIAIDAWIAEQFADHPGIEAVQVRRRLRAAATVRIDPERLRQALANVLANALQAIAARGAEREPEGEIAVSTRREGRWLVIEVADNGCGMSDEVRRRIFEPLFSTKAFGVGLGMALVRRTMEQHGGEVTVQSSPGCGATVTMRLPLMMAE